MLDLVPKWVDIDPIVDDLLSYAMYITNGSDILTISQLSNYDLYGDLTHAIILNKIQVGQVGFIKKTDYRMMRGCFFTLIDFLRIIST